MIPLQIGSAGLKFPQDKRTECEQRDYDEREVEIRSGNFFN